MWKKKQYDITIRLQGEDIDALHWAGYTLTDISSTLSPSGIQHSHIARIGSLAWRIHGKAVKLNRANIKARE